MGRRARDDDDSDVDDERDVGRGKKRKKTTNPLVIIIGIAGLGLFVVVMAVIGIGIVVELKSQAVKPKPVPRDELRKSLMGKTKDEVMAKLGKPDRTTDTLDDIWIYHKISYDPVSNSVDNTTWVEFKNNIVTRVNS